MIARAAELLVLILLVRCLFTAIERPRVRRRRWSSSSGARGGYVSKGRR